MTTFEYTGNDGSATTGSLLSGSTFVKTFHLILFYQIAASHLQAASTISAKAITKPNYSQEQVDKFISNYLPFLRSFRGEVEIPAAASIWGVMPAEVAVNESLSPGTEEATRD